MEQNGWANLAPRPLRMAKAGCLVEPCWWLWCLCVWHATGLQGSLPSKPVPFTLKLVLSPSNHAKSHHTDAILLSQLRREVYQARRDHSACVWSRQLVLLPLVMPPHLPMAKLSGDDLKQAATDQFKRQNCPCGIYPTFLWGQWQGLGQIRFSQTETRALARHQYNLKTTMALKLAASG